MRRLTSVALAITIAMTAILAGVQVNVVAPSSDGATITVSVDTATASAATCSKKMRNFAYRFGGQCWNWRILRDGYGNLVGARFKASEDKLVTAPRRGRMDTSCGQLWSTKYVTRRIWLREMTWWKFGKRQKLTQCALNRNQAAKKYRTPSGSAQYWHRIEGSESTGWIYDGPEWHLYVFHGHIDHRYGKTWAGNWTPKVTKATAWYWN